MIKKRYYLYYKYALLPKLIKMRERGELTELKVEEEKVLIDKLGNETKVQYKGHVDSKGDMTGWGSFVDFDRWSGTKQFISGTFLDRRMEGIIVIKQIGPHIGLNGTSIQEYHKGECMRVTDYRENYEGVLEFSYG